MCEDLTGKPETPAPGSGNAAGKKLCGTCKHKMPRKGIWECFHSFPCPHTGDCPAFKKKPSVIRPPQPTKKSLPVPEGVKFLYFGKPSGCPLNQESPGKPCHWLLPSKRCGHPALSMECQSRSHQGVVTVAWISPSPGTLHLGFSFCSPKDRWCKTTGRDMALARLLNPLVIPFLYSPKRTVHEVTRAVLSHDFGRLAALTPGATMWGRVPDWTRGLGKRMGAPRAIAIYRLPGSAARIIASLKEFEIKHLPLAIMAQMMRDIAALGNG